MSKSRFSNTFAYGFAFLGTATSPGIGWSDVPSETSSPNQSGSQIAIESRNAVIRERALKLDQLISLQAMVGTGGSISHGRYWFEAASDILSTDREYLDSHDTSDAVATIRAALSLQVKELANVLGVSRPTIYSWMRDDEKPQPQNRNRIAYLLRFAKAWNSMSDKPVGALVRNQLSADGKSLVNLLAESEPDDLSLIHI